MLLNNIFKGEKQTKIIRQATNFTVFTSKKGSKYLKFLA
jgi:hypothetical protein